MNGDKIENLKKALKEFLEVLPINSYFNISKYFQLILIYIFGSTYDTMFKGS